MEGKIVKILSHTTTRIVGLYEKSKRFGFVRPDDQRVLKDIYIPEGKEKGTSSLSKDQQKDQHEKVKDAVINRKSQSGISFFSLASGTKLDKMEVDIGNF